MKNNNPSYLVSMLSIGTMLEWAEYVFYGYLALTLSSLFFPLSDPNIGIIKTYGIFAAGYLMRPLGALFFGHIGDKWGRKPALMGSLFLMGIATFGIGVLPTYGELGVVAAVFLLLLRMIQGFSVAGEYNGAGLFVIEQTHNNKPCFTSSWICASAAAGMVMGGIAAYIVSHPLAASWAWRVPFILGGISCFLGIAIRSQLNDSTHKKTAHFPIVEILKKHRRSLLVVAAISAFIGIYVYIGNIYIVTFLKQYAGLTAHQATFYAILGETLSAVLIPVMGFLADKRDYVKQFTLGLLGVAIGSPVLFYLAASGEPRLILLAMGIFALGNGVVCGPLMKILYDQFPAQVRYTGISFGWSLSAAVFSGTAPLVAQILTTRWNWMLGPSFYISLTAIIVYIIVTSFINAEKFKETGLFSGSIINKKQLLPG